MSSPSPAHVAPPRLIFCVLLLVASLAAALVFASVFEQARRLSDDELCGELAPSDKSAADVHASHGEKPAAPAYYVGGLWSPDHGQAAQLDAAMLSAVAGQPIICMTAVSNGEQLLLIDRSPIRYSSASQLAQETLPLLVLSIDHAGRLFSSEFAAWAALQKYIADEQANYNKILIVEPLPGPKRDPEEEWTYLNRDSIKKVQFFTPKRKASPAEVVQSLYAELRGSAPASSDDVAALVEQLASEDAAKAADARMALGAMSPYQVVSALNKWVGAAGDGNRAQRVYEALMIRKAMGIHADRLIEQAAESKSTALRELAARAVGDLADVTTDPLGVLTPLAEDSEQAVRYEALIATRSMPGRRAAGVARLVEPYEMTSAMLTLYKGTMAQMLTYGEPIAADSKFSRTLRMPITEALAMERDLIVCNALLQRTDLPDDKIDEVLGKLAEINGQGPLVTLLNLLETMNPSTLAKREVLLKNLVDWKTNELKAQLTRLKEMALGNGSDNLRRAAAAAMIMSADMKTVLAEIGASPVTYEALGWVTDPAVLKRWAEPIFRIVRSAGDMPPQTTIAAVDAIGFLPADSVTKENGVMLLGLAKEADEIALRFAAIRAVKALPADVVPDGADALSLTMLDIAAIPGQMKYDKEKLTVVAGQPVELTLTNPDTMEHNLVITLPGRAQAVGVAVSADTNAAASDYMPNDMSTVLHHTKMVPAGGKDVLRFIAPSKPGSYEYVCTFPGHYTSMRGVLEVVEP